MSPEDLGRRAVACKHWRWMPGMIALSQYRVTDQDAETDEPTPWVDDVPDLSDPATLGCLLALVREAWGDATADVIHFDVWKTNGTWGHEWTVQCRDAGRFTKSRGATEAEALVAALEAAP